MNILQVLRFPYQKRLYNRGHLNVATEILEGLIPGAFVVTGKGAAMEI